MFPSLTMLLAQISKLMGSYIRSTHQSASYSVSSCSKADLSSLFVSLRDGELAGRADERGGALAGPRGRWPGHVAGPRGRRGERMDGSSKLLMSALASGQPCMSN